MAQTVVFNKGKVNRNELELPTLHFIVTDQWIDVIGEKALIAWLKMYSWCKRDDENSEINHWEQARIPKSLQKVIKDLGVGRDTFYNKILKPLWNVGLIDLEEFNDSSNKGTKPINIIVYKYPQNDFKLAIEPLQLIRNYETDYHSEARTFSKKGGRPRIDKGGSNIEHPPVPEQNTLLFQNRTGGGSETGDNNNLNSFSNSSNPINNDLNLSIKESDIENLSLPVSIKKQMIKKIDRLIDDGINIKEIETIYHSYKEHITENQFAHILFTVLDKTKKPIKNINNLISIAISNYFENLNQLTKPEKKINQRNVGLPKYIKEQTVPKLKDNPTFEEKKRQLEKRLKKYK